MHLTSLFYFIFQKVAVHPTMSRQEDTSKKFMGKEEGTPMKVRRVDANVSDDQGAPSTSSKAIPQVIQTPVHSQKSRSPSAVRAQPTAAPSANVNMEVDVQAGPSKLPEEDLAQLKDKLTAQAVKFKEYLSNLGAGLNSFGTILKNFVTAQTAQIEAVIAAEKYKWVRDFKHRPFAVTKEHQPPEGDEFIAAHNTHQRSLQIPDTWCFEVSTRIVNLYPEQKKKLGVCVTIPKGYFESWQDLCCNRCQYFSCKACPHKYLCNCDSKENGWCPHIHVAYARNLDVYGEEVSFFILDDPTNKTEKRHIRAIIQGRGKMIREEEDVWVERFDYLVRSERYTVKVNTAWLPKDRCMCSKAKRCLHCDACWCRYNCTCEDYWDERQVCEHIHIVAMNLERAEQRSNADFTFDEFHESKMITQEDDYVQQDQYEWMVEEHDLSFYVAFKHIAELEKDTTWSLLCSAQKKNFIVTVYKSEQSECICEKPETTKAMRCKYCNICKFHYRCPCKAARILAVPCSHMHAIERFRKEQIVGKKTPLDLQREAYFEHLKIDEEMNREEGLLLIRKPLNFTEVRETEDPRLDSSQDIEMKSIQQ